jgi:hypothetical protein
MTFRVSLLALGALLLVSAMASVSAMVPAPPTPGGWQCAGACPLHRSATEPVAHQRPVQWSGRGHDPARHRTPCVERDPPAIGVADRSPGLRDQDRTGGDVPFPRIAKCQHQRRTVPRPQGQAGRRWRGGRRGETAARHPSSGLGWTFGRVTSALASVQVVRLGNPDRRVVERGAPGLCRGVELVLHRQVHHARHHVAAIHHGKRMGKARLTLDEGAGAVDRIDDEAALRRSRSASSSVSSDSQP